MKTKLNILVNIIAFIAFTISAISGILLWLFKLSSRQLMKQMHLYSSLAMILLVIIHLILHWKWITLIPKMLKN